MTRKQADKDMKNKYNRELWIMEATGTGEEVESTKYHKGFLYVIWGCCEFCNREATEAEIYDTSNIYGECEDVITLEEYDKMKEYTTA